MFIGEQVLYTKEELERHNRTGDLTGPMAESGFKGHPQCNFCRSRHYGDNELFLHMQSAHERCFLCLRWVPRTSPGAEFSMSPAAAWNQSRRRSWEFLPCPHNDTNTASSPRRAKPEQFVYYRNYNELERHFRTQHFACDHPTCLEKRFVGECRRAAWAAWSLAFPTPAAPAAVFPSEEELKQHSALEHGEGMSKAQRKANLTIPIDIRVGLPLSASWLGGRLPSSLHPRHGPHLICWPVPLPLPCRCSARARGPSKQQKQLGRRSNAGPCIGCSSAARTRAVSPRPSSAPLSAPGSSRSAGAPVSARSSALLATARTACSDAPPSLPPGLANSSRHGSRAALPRTGSSAQVNEAVDQVRALQLQEAASSALAEGNYDELFPSLGG